MNQLLSLSLYPPPAAFDTRPSSARSEEGLRLSSTDIIRSFISQHVPGVKRIGKGMISLIERFVEFKKRNVKIDEAVEVFISSAEMRSYARDYAPFRDACFRMKGYSNYRNGKCDLIIGYTSAFEDLFIALLKAQLQYHLPSTPLYLANKVCGNTNHNYDLIGNLTPGADVSLYHQTEKSPRYYIWLQNLSKEDKKFVYEGCVDLDITACHPTIFFNEVLHRQTDNPYMNMMIKDPDAFLNALIDAKVYKRLYPHVTVTDERAAAKDARSRLFNLQPGGLHNKSGVIWYDELQSMIIRTLEAFGISDSHKFFANHERKIVQTAIAHIGAEHVVLLMHDGLILRNVDPQVAAALAATTTGYAWKWARL